MTNSVKYDFLYADYDRICSFLTAMSGVGYLESLSETKGKEIAQEYSGSADVLVAKGEMGTAKTNSESKTADYGVAWHNIFLFINAHKEKIANSNNIKISDYDIAHISGNMFLMDSHIVAGIAGGYSREYQAIPFNERYKANKLHTNTNDFYKQDLPSSFEAKQQMAMDRAVDKGINAVTGIIKDNNKESNYWFTIDNEENLYQNTKTLLLKYGFSLGEWQTICIIDDMGQNTDKKRMADNPFPTKTYTEMYDAIYRRTGRPDNHIGITPLLIYRIIS